MTSVGYGDALPVTQAGKILGSIIALTGISFVALPAGILGAGFLEEFQNRRNEKQKTTTNSESLGVATEIREYVRCETTDIYIKIDATSPAASFSFYLDIAVKLQFSDECRKSLM